MDDLDVIRQTLNAPPPSAAATAKASSRLAAAIDAAESERAAAGLRRSLRTFRSPRPRRSPRSLRWTFAGAAAVAGLVAAVLVAALVSSGLPRSTPGTAVTATSSAHVSARAILLAAADQVARNETATSGRYWHIRRIVGTGPYRVGTAPNQYDIIGRRLDELWMARSSRDKSWEGRRELGFAPRTRADERAWRKAGSPTEWTVDSDPDPTSWRTAPGKGTLHPVDASDGYLLGLGGLTFAQVQQLPTDPAKLRAFLVARIAANDDKVARGASAGESYVQLVDSLSGLLLDVPAPADLRAAAFRVLAEIPGMHSMGVVTDSEGRSGVGIELTQRSGGGWWHSELVLDPATNLILASRMSAGAVGDDQSRPAKEAATVILEVGWTDERPRTPAIP
jgi:hypothetical protein